MYPLALILIGILIVVPVLLFNFRFLLYPLLPHLNPMTEAQRLSLDGPSLFISDLHLRADRPFQYSQSLRHLLEARHVSNLIVVGDLFDSPQDAERIMARGSSDPITNTLGFAGLPIKAFFVQGSPPHDPKLKKRNVFADTSVTVLGRCAVLELNHMRVVAYHGQDLSWKGAIAHSWDRFVSKLSLERAWKRRAGVADSDWVIFGHTHLSGIDEKHRVANCGGWQSKRFFVRPACTGLLLLPEYNALEIVRFA